MKHLCHAIIICLTLATVVAGCSDRGRWVRDDALYVAEGIEVYPECIILDGKEHNAISPGYITNTWVSPDSAARGVWPSLTCGSSLMAEALWRKAMEQPQSMKMTTEEAWLTGAILTPGETMAALRSLVGTDGMIAGPTYPEVMSNMAWGAAAWEVYCATGSSAWLKEAYGVMTRTLAAREPALKGYGELLHGAPSYLRSSTGGAYGGFYPSWMGPVDVYATTSTGVNAWHYATLSTLALMAEELGLEREKSGWHGRAARLRNDINDTFWIPQLTYYGQYTYGDYYPILSTAADNVANPLCVMLSIATPEMGKRVVESRPSLSRGFPMVYPMPGGGAPSYSLLAQVFQGIASTLVGSDTEVLRALGPLWVMALRGNARWPWPAVVARGLLGIGLVPDGMELNPYLPEVFSGGLTLEGLRYRDAVIDISVKGKGDRVVSFMIDSVAQSHHVVPATLQGGHRVDITLSGGSNGGGSARAMTKEPAHDQERIYNVYINGVLTRVIGEPNYSLAVEGCRTVEEGKTAVVSIVPQEGLTEGFASRAHIYAPAANYINIPATAITPRRPPLHLIRDKATAARYIELAARHNTRITFYVQAPEAGEYFFNIDYSNGTGDAVERSVEVNGMPAGVIVCPSVTPGNWVATHPSSILKIRLNEGTNKISLTYINSTILLNHIHLLKK